MNLAVHSPKGARRVVFGFMAGVVILVLLGAVVIRTYTIDRNEEQAQRIEDKAQAQAQRAEDQAENVALKDAVNVLADQLKREGVKPVVDNAGEVDPSGGIGPIGPPGRDGRDGPVGITPPCLFTPTQCVGAAGATGATPAAGTNGTNGKDSTVPGPPGADSNVPGPGGPAGADSAVPGPPGPECPVGYTAADRPAPLPSTEVWRVCVMDAP